MKYTEMLQEQWDRYFEIHIGYDDGGGGGGGGGGAPIKDCPPCWK